MVRREPSSGWTGLAAGPWQTRIGSWIVRGQSTVKGQPIARQDGARRIGARASRGKFETP